MEDIEMKDKTIAYNENEEYEIIYFIFFKLLKLNMKKLGSYNKKLNF